MLAQFRKRIRKSVQLWVVLSLVAMLGGGVSLYLLRSTDEKPAVVPKLSHAKFMAEQHTLVDQLKEQGTQAMFASLKQKMKENPSIARECHPMLHGLGHAAFDHLGGFSEAMAYQDEFCNSGFTHGVIESAFVNSSDWVQTMRLVCPSESTTDYKQWQCFHGVGHGLMYALSKDTTKALASCEQLTAPSAVASCANGVFMEKFIIVGHTGERKKVAVDHTFCKQQAKEYKTDCYIYAPTAFLQDHPNAYGDAFTLCEQVEKDYAGACRQGVGSQAMKENIVNPAFAAALCGKIQRSMRDSCVQGAISVHITHYGTPDRAEKLCTGTFNAFKSVCQATVQEKRSKLFR